MVLNLGITPETIASSEKRKQAISRMPRLSSEEYISQARKMLGVAKSETKKPKS